MSDDRLFLRTMPTIVIAHTFSPWGFLLVVLSNTRVLRGLKLCEESRT